jgi:hypothetical protein
MKHFFLYLILSCLFVPLRTDASTLHEMYDHALAGLGYDKLIILDGDSIYTGGLVLSNEKIGIKGRGAIIDLQGSTIDVSGNAVFDLDECVVLNGSSGIYATQSVSSRITHCTFCDNQIGIYFMAASGRIEVLNTVIANNSQYGFACEKSTIRILHYIDTFNNMEGDYLEWCPG